MRSQIDRDALEDFEQFENALRAFAAERGTQTASVAPPPSRWRVLAVRAGVLVAVGVMAAGVVELARMQRKLARATAVAEVGERELADSEQRIRELMSRNAARRSEVPSPTSALLFPLVKVRGATPNPSQNRVTLPGSPAWVILLAELAAPAGSSRYRATIETIDGQFVWSDDRFASTHADTVTVGVLSNLLPPGDYVMTLDEQAGRSSTWQPVGRYAFRVASRVR